MNFCGTLELRKESSDITWNNGLLEHSGLVITCSKEEFDLPSGIGGTMQSSGVAHVPAGLARCNGVVRLLVVEHDIPPHDARWIDAHAASTIGPGQRWRKGHVPPFG